MSWLFLAPCPLVPLALLRPPLPVSRASRCPAVFSLPARLCPVAVSPLPLRLLAAAPRWRRLTVSAVSGEVPPRRVPLSRSVVLRLGGWVD